MRADVEFAARLRLDIARQHGARNTPTNKQPATLSVEPLVPAVNPKKSVFPDYIVCLEDGKKFKSLKRHLRTDFGLTPDQYRAKWGLPHDYPMVAPEYSDRRSAMAKATGLGRKAEPVKKALAKRKA